MEKHQIADGIFLYMFEPRPDRHYGYNITALIENGQAMLIDTAFEEHAQQVYEDLSSQGIAIKGVILTHFHADHIYGLKALPQVPIYGSAHYQVTLDMWTDPGDHPYFTPDIVFDQHLQLPFGSFELTLLSFPGHAHCSALVLINGQYAHIGDELMFTNGGEAILPSVDSGQYVGRHRDSLNKLKEYGDYALIPSHGSVISGREAIERDIANRIAYFEAILASEQPISYDEAVRNCDGPFLHQEWHRNVYRS
ncbi:MBL fold metallo-hydrolase [Paenibacillus thiaminolyticus]|uniref:MBL fold metallo-hydrolase n=1 Tax=Paenibacillus thiaminolyticus TaxID=49283 RepID=UPI002350D279|nr:MBL fold metallo-hydrolase [Paenibacillus thiaminolyticus]WCR25945.1 MBL fold metallo-hydrolase [Paenibacillus thiaminolyticus]